MLLGISYKVDAVNRSWEAAMQLLILIISTKDLQLRTEDILLKEMAEGEKM